MKLLKDIARQVAAALGLSRPAAAPSAAETERPPIEVVEQPRLSFPASWARLQQLGLVEGATPAGPPERLPRFDDEPSGVNFFREVVEGHDLSNLTLSRTFVGRSEIRSVSFRNVDLNESNLCWNDVIDVDFSAATLTGCDMRSSEFEGVNFGNADLRRADLRHSGFTDCNFGGADLTGAIVSVAQAKSLGLSKQQTAALDARADDGPEPDGG